jgi:hypothetical protein
MRPVQTGETAATANLTGRTRVRPKQTADTSSAESREQLISRASLGESYLDSSTNCLNQRGSSPDPCRIDLYTPLALDLWNFYHYLNSTSSSSGGGSNSIPLLRQRRWGRTSRCRIFNATSWETKLDTFHGRPGTTVEIKCSSKENRRQNTRLDAFLIVNGYMIDERGQSVVAKQGLAQAQ